MAAKLQLMQPKPSRSANPGVRRQPCKIGFSKKNCRRWKKKKPGRKQTRNADKAGNFQYDRNHAPDIDNC